MGLLKIKVGCRLVLDLLAASGSVERLVVELVPDNLADYDSGLLGESTPLARVLLGQEPGRKIPYRMGDLVAVHILAVEPGGSQVDDSAAVRRQQAAQKAAHEVDQTNAIVFASSFSGKWGDYDPTGVEQWDKNDADPPDNQAVDKKAE